MPQAAPPVPGAAQARRRRGRRRNLLSAAGSAVAHLAVLLALIFAHRGPLIAPEIEPMTVELVQAPPAPVVAPPAPEPPTPVKPPPPPPRNLARRARTPPPPDVRPLPAGDSRRDGPGVELTDAQLASAAAAGSGGGGRPCDMAQRLQAALRKDPRVQAAVADARARGAGGKALFLWNGDWIRSRGEEGEGLAAVREAIMWEVAFAPEACRAEPVHGLVLFSMADGPGSAGLVVGSGAWRWSDLLRPRGGG